MGGKAKFKFWSFFFSLRGRVSRNAFITFELPVLALLFGGQFAFQNFDAVFLHRHDKFMASLPFLIQLFIVLEIILAWPRFAIMVRRLHDLGLPWYSGLPLIVAFSAQATYSASAYMFKLLPPIAMEIDTFIAKFLPILGALNFGIILLACFFPSTKGANRYGLDPRRASNNASDVF